VDVPPGVGMYVADVEQAQPQLSDSRLITPETISNQDVNLFEFCCI